MRILGRSAGVFDNRDSGGICPELDYHRLPRNPVFYPPTPRDNGIDDAFTDNGSIVVDDQRRGNRLVSRIKTMFSSKGPLSHNPKQHTSGNAMLDANSAGTLFISRRRGSEQGVAPQRPKLVARSPIREGCISPEFFAFADIACLDTTLPTGKQGQAGNLGKKLKRRNFTTSVCLPSFDLANYTPSAGRNYSLGTNNTTLTRAKRTSFSETADLKNARHGVSRSQSFAASRKAIPQTLVPSLSALPQEPCHTLPELELFEDNPRKHRDSRGSEKTAVFDMEPSSVYVNNDIELPCLGLSEHLKTNSTSSPSQKTLSGACTMLCDEQHIHGIFADNMMTERTIADMAFDQEMDVFQTCSSKSRRHYSVGIPEHLQPAENSGTQPALGGTGGVSGCVAAPLNSQWAMYARSSYAESGLVKSTFDLVKLLPSAPQ